MIPYEPTKIDRPFAYNGARNDIPVDGGTETGNASLDLGFPPITSQPLSQGGIPPQRKDFNGILYMLSAYAYYAQAGGLYAWDEEIDYAVNCVITHNNNIYICIANNGASTAAGVVEPGSDEAYWLELFVYLLRASGGNVGSPVNPMYIANGQFVASTANVGSDLQPTFMNNGVITASSGNVGDENTPVFMKNGILAACTSGGTGVRDYKLGEAGYVRFDFGLIIQWGTRPTTGSPQTGWYYTVTFPVAFTSGSSYVIVKNMKRSGSGNTDDIEISFYNKTATTAYTKAGASNGTTGWSGDEEWLAIGY